MHFNFFSKKSSLTLILFCFVAILKSQAQPTSIRSNENPYKWMFGLSWSIVDDNGHAFTKIFDIPRSYNMEYFPSRIMVDRYLQKKWSLEFSATYNKYKGSKLINGEVGNSGLFICADAHAKYNFLNGKKRFDPYASAGIGGTFRQTQSSPVALTVNLSLGTNYWFSAKWGMQIQGTAKVAALPTFFTSNGNYTHYTVGVVYRTGGKKQSSDFDKRRYPWMNDKKKYKRKNA